jgi:D-alanine--poly(phosphoribitol) ligase subunit 1
MQTNVIEYLENGALVRCPDKVAVIDGEKTYTFAQLADAARRCARDIIAVKDVIRRPIAVFLPKGAATVIADLGIIYSGNCYMNLDTKSPAPRIRSILDNVKPETVITSRELAPSIRELVREEGGLLFIEDALEPGPEASSDLLRRRLDAVIDVDPLCIINTSGSTGIPKAVVMSHRNVIDFMDWVMDELRLDGSETIGSLSPFYFDIYTLELYLSLAKGATIVVIPEQLSMFPVRLVEYLAQHSVSFIFWVPTIMVSIANLDLLPRGDLKGLRKVLFAGEVFPTRHFNYWRRHLPQATFVNLYGPIEITVDCTYYVVDREFQDDEPLPIGRPRRNVDIIILNDRNEPAGVNQEGELCVRGSSIALGYWNDAAKTEQAFACNPLNPSFSELIYRTGDTAYRNERGEIMFVGRKDHQIKHLGYRIELGEIEHAALAVAGLGNACVLYDKANREITLFYEASGEVSPATIRRELSSSLPKYMLPTVFHRLDALPRNPNGKIDRLRLAAEHARPGFGRHTTK